MTALLTMVSHRPSNCVAVVFMLVFVVVVVVFVFEGVVIFLRVVFQTTRLLLATSDAIFKPV